MSYSGGESMRFSKEKAKERLGKFGKLSVGMAKKTGNAMGTFAKNEIRRVMEERDFRRNIDREAERREYRRYAVKKARLKFSGEVRPFGNSLENFKVGTKYKRKSIW